MEAQRLGDTDNKTIGQELWNEFYEKIKKSTLADEDWTQPISSTRVETGENFNVLRGERMSGRTCRIADMGTTRLDPSKYTVQIQKGSGLVTLIRSVNEGAGTTNVDVIYQKDCQTLDDALYSTTGHRLKKGGLHPRMS